MVSPAAIVFDVNETLSDMNGLSTRLADVGIAADTVAVRDWFTAVLRDGFALTAAGGSADFSQIATDELQRRLAKVCSPAQAQAAAHHMMDGLATLTVHPDVPEAIRSLHAHGFRLLTMTNGNAASTDRLLRQAGLREHFELLLDSHAAHAWKPARAAYEHVLRESHLPAEQVLLAAVHPWDIDGARRAGLNAAWISRSATGYPAYMTPPTLTAENLTDLATLLLPAR
ncbi:haloacid dehalogenase type II [Streptomyces sp. NPDC017230]|uniref:haloacid dehalogenase type II n=1 Tax=unclassified Streptomyces TaxID=2593676 RepID=UPI0037963433